MEKIIPLLYFDLTQYNEDKIRTTITVGDFVTPELVQKLIDQLVLIQNPGSFAALTPFQSSSLVPTALPEIENLNYDDFFEYLKAKINDDKSIIINRNLKSNPISKLQLKSLSIKDLKIYWRIIAIYDNLRKFLRSYIMDLGLVESQNNLPCIDNADRPDAKLLNLDLKQKNPIAHYFFLAQILSLYYSRFSAEDGDISPSVYHYLQMKFQIDRRFHLHNFHPLINLAHRLQSNNPDERAGDFSVFFQSTLSIANAYIRFKPDASLQNYIDILISIIRLPVAQGGEKESSQNRNYDYYKPSIETTRYVPPPFIKLINLLMKTLVEFYGNENLAAQAILPFTVNCANWTLALGLKNILFFMHVKELLKHLLDSLPIADDTHQIQEKILNDLKLQHLRVDNEELIKITSLCFSDFPDDDWSDIIYRNAILLEINLEPKETLLFLQHQLLTQENISARNAQQQFGINPRNITTPTLTPKIPNTTPHPHKKTQPIQKLLTRLFTPLLFMTYLSLCLFLNHCLTLSLSQSLLIPRSDL